MAGKDGSKDAVHRARLSLGERLLRELQLQTQGRVPERRDHLLDERTARAGRTLADSLQHHQTSLLAGLQTTSTGGTADKRHGAWRSGNRCDTLTLPTAQKIGHSKVDLG